MRPIISNDGLMIYARPDFFSLNRTMISSTVVSGSATLPVVNPAGFAAKDYLMINDPGQDRAEMVQISSVIGNNITISSLNFGYDLKTSVYKMGYNLINFYKGSTLITSVSIRPDYYTSIAETVVTDYDYTVTFYNKETSKETPNGESVTLERRLLCSESDIMQYESQIYATTSRLSILDKIDIASREIYNLFEKQSIDFKNLDDRELLRPATALLALYYYFNSTIKLKEDMATIKADNYLSQYKAKLDDVIAVINATDNDVQVFGGQTMAVR